MLGLAGEASMDEVTDRDPVDVQRTDEANGHLERAAPAPIGEAERGSADDLTTDRVLDALKNVYDPELGINIVDLGLVYDVAITDGDVHIEYALTTMGCPIGPLIEQQMNAILTQLPGVRAVDAEMVLRPPWSPEMMSEEAKAALGYF
jgi:metal-sulfur cluster biosynthetic enzyme